MMDRRAFIGGVALGALASRAASAQPARKVARIWEEQLGERQA